MIFTLFSAHFILNRGWNLQAASRMAKQKGQTLPTDPARYSPSCIGIALYGYLAGVLMILQPLIYAWGARNWVLVGLSLGAIALLTLLLIAKLALERRYLRRA